MLLSQGMGRLLNGYREGDAHGYSVLRRRDLIFVGRPKLILEIKSRQEEATRLGVGVRLDYPQT